MSWRLIGYLSCYILLCLSLSGIAASSSEEGRLEIFSVSGEEQLTGTEVSDNRLFIRSTNGVYVVEDGGSVTSRFTIGNSRVFQPYKNLSNHVLWCNTEMCSLRSTNNLGISAWTVSADIEANLQHSTLVNVDDTTLALQTGQTVPFQEGSSTNVLDVLRYDFSFSSTDYTNKPSTPPQIQLSGSLRFRSRLCTTCTGEYLEVVSDPNSSSSSQSYYIFSMFDEPNSNAGGFTAIYKILNSDKGTRVYDITLDFFLTTFVQVQNTRLTCDNSKSADIVKYGRSDNGGVLYASFQWKICKILLSSITFGDPSEPSVAMDLLNIDTQANITALGSISRDGFQFLIVGQNGSLKQYYVQSDPINAILVNEVQLPNGVAMEINPKPDKSGYYVTTEQKVIFFPISNCEQHKDCTTCLTSIHPLCGWCANEGRCGLETDCTMGFVSHGNTESCPMIAVVQPMNVYIVDNRNVTITTRNVPDLEYNCRFKFQSENIEFTKTATMVTADKFSCMSPNETALKPIVDSLRGNAKPLLQLVRRDTGASIVETSDLLNFFDCRAFVQCLQCVAHDTCQWCPGDVACKPVMTACSSNIAPYTNNTSDRCPQVIATPTAEVYSIPAHVDQMTRLRTYMQFADNTLRNTSYTCMFEGVEVNGRLIEKTLPTEGISTAVVECDSHEFTLNGAVQRMVDFSIIFDSNYIIENPKGLKIFVYSCSSLSVDCAQCIRLPEELTCGYCIDTNSCSMREDCNGIVSNSNMCPMNILEFSPKSGPKEGGTTVLIKGLNLIPHLPNMATVNIGNSKCTVKSDDTFIPAKQFSCVTEKSSDDGTPRSPISVTFKDSANMTRQLTSEKTFSFIDLSVSSVQPINGIQSGGTVLTIQGPSLTVGSTHKVTLKQTSGDLDCPVLYDDQYVKPNQLFCKTAKSIEAGRYSVEVTVDRWTSSNTGSTVMYSYELDPEVNSVDLNQTFEMGGIDIQATGMRLDPVQTAIIFFEQTSSRRKRQAMKERFQDACTEKDSVLVCLSPNVTFTGEMSEFMVGFQLDGLEVEPSTVNQIVQVYKNPTFTSIRGGNVEQPSDNLMDIVIEGTIARPDLVKQYVTVQIANDSRATCDVIDVTESQLTCHPDNIPVGTHAVTVVLGNQRVTVGQLTIVDPLSVLLIGLMSALGAVLLCAALILIIGCCICQRRVKKKDQQLDEMQLELHQIEVSVVNTVKSGFAELHAEIEETIGDQNTMLLPYRDLPGYVFRCFFQDGEPIDVLLPLDNNVVKTRDFLNGLSEFRRLIQDKKFLLMTIRALEQQKSFDIIQRSQFAQLLMILLCQNLEYATDVLRLLISDQIEMLNTRGEAHLFMRKNQSVVDKMASCWLSLCLRDHLEDSPGCALYMLMKATKSQLEKGPVDVITGEAKYSLSERTILRSLVEDPKEIIAIVESEDGGRFTVKLLDCDTISQAKEKIMDVLYRSVKVSDRHGIATVDLEYKVQPKDSITLRDDDKSSLVDGSWKRINTLKHYKIPAIGAVFRLIPRTERPSNGHVFDHLGTLMVDHDGSGTLRHQKAAAKFSSDGHHLWHMSKQVDPTLGSSPFAGRKLMTEIFFPQMMYTKSVLQKFVDDFVDCVFTTSNPLSSIGSVSAVYANVNSNPVPIPLKHLFDLLDQEGMESGITANNLTHIWKCNTYVLRFWVNILKNPEFLFDISKSHTMDACLSVVAQALMDSCSVSEERLTRDAPAGRLLFHKDVKKYKTTIRKYFDDIRNQPPVSRQQVKQYLSKLSNRYKNALLNTQSGVNIDRVTYGLFNLVNKHSETVTECLDNTGLSHQAQTFSSIRKAVV